MTSRAAQPDTPADIQVRTCLTTTPLRSFVMVAGAGSGKTTSLVKALAAILSTHGGALKKSRKRVACITYTEIAASEIWNDVGNSAVVHVSTIHSFLWSIVRTFQEDIRRWVIRRLDERLTELRATAAGFGPRVQARTRERNRRDIERYEAQLGLISAVPSFKYGTGSDYPKGVLGHDDIIRMSTTLILEKPVLRTLVGQQFPFIFVDESQDTMPAVVDCLRAVQKQMAPHFCLGFFGDPMQRIYATGIGDIQTEDEWLVIKKEENFRCPTSVLAVANAIRRDGDGLQQVRGRTTRVDGVDVPVPGTARIFVLPADEQRSERLLQVRQWIAEANHDPAWRAGESADLKVLLIVHRMAATRLGFANLYAAMNDDAPEAFKAGLLEGTAWPLRPFLAFVLPLCSALRDEAQFKAMSILREQCPRLARSALTSADTEDVLQAIRQSTGELASMMAAESTATNRQVLQLLREANLVALDPRLLSYLEEAPPPADDAPDDDAEATLEAGAMDRFLACAAREFWGYSEYMNRESPFVTQQGIKGAEFPKVLVVLDDDEGTHVQFSYDKYFGIKPLSQRDQENLREGKETAVERTRRLFYVCCTRALTDLAVVLFSSDVTLAEERVRALSIFPNDQVLTLAAIENSPVQ